MHMHRNRNICLRALALALLAATALISFGAYTGVNRALATGDVFGMDRAPDLEALPTPEPEPEPSEDSSALGLPKGKRAKDSFFNYTLFVGDSVTLKLERYVRDKRKDDPNLLGKAKFFCAGSLGSGNLQEKISPKSNHPSLKGKKMMLEDAVVASKAKKVYIMLGMNDIAVYGIQGSVDNMMSLIRKVRKKSPKVQIYVQSATPRIKGKDQKKLNNANLEKYNQQLCQAVQDYGKPGVYFVDVASVLRGPDGTLPMEYCSDPESQGIHFTNKACKIWIDYLYTHTPQ